MSKRKTPPPEIREIGDDEKHPEEQPHRRKDSLDDLTKLTDGGMSPSKALDKLHVVAELKPAPTREPSVPVCGACGKVTEKPDTHNNKKHEPVCHTCNVMLCRKFGKDYGNTVDDLKSALALIQGMKVARKDRRWQRAIYNR